jgi:mono/diheme cytochrome c family protein
MRALTPKIWVIALALSAPSAWADGDVAQGRKIAEQHCSRCHVIGTYNKYGGIGSTPSFQLLANQFPDYRARFEIFFEEHPHPAFVTIEGYGRRMEHLPPNAAPVTLPLAAVADILAFVETLRTGKEKTLR